MNAKTKAQLLTDIEALQKHPAELQTFRTESHQKNDLFKIQARFHSERDFLLEDGIK